jgi:hypothetical protein
MLRLARATVLSLLLPLSAASGQTQSGDPAVTHLRVDASLLRTARYVYELSASQDGAAQPLGWQTISFSDAMYAGAPSWLILESRMGGGIPGLDSLIASRDVLAPLHWGASIGLARLAAEFTRDTVYGATSSPLGKRSLVGPAPRGVIAGEGMLDGLLQLAPLDYGWAADATLLVADVSGTRLLAAHLMAEREEEVTVPAGTFAAWVVSLRTGQGEKRIWVSKQPRLVVKSTQTLPQMNGAVLERVLVRVDDPALVPPPAVPLPNDHPADTARGRIPSAPARDATSRPPAGPG